MIYKIIYFASLISYINAEKELMFVQVIHNNGARTPLDTYAKDPYRNVSFWPSGMGQLTNEGKKQLYELGQWLRNRYTEFLPETYNFKDIYVRSTDVDRTLMSSEMCVLGLYPPMGYNKRGGLNCQPIPIHTVPEQDDIMLRTTNKCPQLYKEMQYISNHEIIKKYNEQLQPLYQYISNYTGENVDSMRKLNRIYNTLTSERDAGLKLPRWTESIYPDKFQPWIKLYYNMKNFNLVLKRLRNGLLLNEIFSKFVMKSEGKLKPDRKMWIYSAHRTTLAETLMVLHAFNYLPPHGSAIVFELWKEYDNYYISVIYKNHSKSSLLYILDYTSCPLDIALKYMQPYMLTLREWEVECNSTVMITVFSLIMISIILLMMVTLICLLAKYIIKEKF